VLKLKLKLLLLLLRVLLLVVLLVLVLVLLLLLALARQSDESQCLSAVQERVSSFRKPSDEASQKASRSTLRARNELP
jgi:hypothetical protein